VLHDLQIIAAFPLSTRCINLRIPAQNRWTSLPFNYHEAEFFRSWLVYDLELDAPRRMNRDVILGMGLVLLVSASFWTGVGLAIAQVWK
jgi:hypothetical protein